MRILAFDSTARLASVAVCEDERLLALYNIDNGLTHSELLLPMAEDMLRALRLNVKDIDLLAVTVGPGSFTGVRIGAALVKGLAFGRDIPCAEVSTLESLAENMRGARGIVVPCMDARRAQVYTATFRADGDALYRMCEDRAISISELAEELRGVSEPIYIVGDGYAVARKGLSDLGVSTEVTPALAIGQSAASTAAVAFRMLRSGKVVSDSELAPTYLRKPQAERERLERLKNENRESKGE